MLVPPEGNVLDVLAEDKNLSILVDLLKAAKLGDNLSGAGPFTILAPTNKVWGFLPVIWLTGLYKGKEENWGLIM